MSIRLSIKANDSEVKGLLAYLTNLPLETEDKILLLERTLKRLRSASAQTYEISLDSEELIQLDVDATFPTAAPPVDAHSARRAE